MDAELRQSLEDLTTRLEDSICRAETAIANNQEHIAPEERRQIQQAVYHLTLAKTWAARRFNV